MKIPCVLVMENDSLLKRAVAGILQDSAIELSVCVSSAQDVTDLAAEILRLQPDVVLLTESMPLSKLEVLTQIQTAFPLLRLIVVSEESNSLHIFRGEDRMVTSLPDFLSIIQSA